MRGGLLAEISHRLGTHAGFNEKMPPNFEPTTPERNQLLNYLNKLVSE
jgi:hypothetical protein